MIYGDYIYDKRETFILSDGGTIFLDMKGKSFLRNDKADKLTPLLFVLPGLTSTS